MRKSYRKNIYNKQRTNYYSNKKYNINGRKKPKNFYKTFLKQLFISIIIVLLIILIKSIDSPITKETTSLIKNTIYAEFDYKKSLNSIREYASDLKDITRKTIPVFNKESESSNTEFAIPLEGIVVSTYGEKFDFRTEKYSFQKGIDIQSTDERIVKSIQDGMIESIGKNENLGNFIKIRHDDKMFSLYYNLSSVFVQKNQKILKGERIGEINDLPTSYLHFELWINEKPVDPQEYLNYLKISI